MSEDMTTSAYIHIPFCKSKCKYCSFISGTDLDKKDGYLYSLLKEIDYYYGGEQLKTLYIGGGTPSLLSAIDLKKIVSKFNFLPGCELTIEVNPNDIDLEYAQVLKNIGFNRVSMGAQSFDDKILENIGRRHNSGEIYKGVEVLRKAGFDNISLDLIYGLPEQTTDSFSHDLYEVIKLGVEHISLYGLKIDKGCYFSSNPPANLPDDDTQADMYLLAGEITSKSGYNHYEISNYSKSGYSSKHNTNYWKCGNYYGFGLAAHGYTDGVRYSNTTDLQTYLSSPVTREAGRFLTEKEKLEEKIFLGFRLSGGIDVSEINNKFSIDFNKRYSDVLDKYLNTGHIIKTDKGYAFSDSKLSNGFLLSNIILSEFI